MVISQYEVFLVEPDPAKGHEIKKTRPCLVLSPDEMNHAIGTVIIAPMTTQSHKYPTRIGLEFEGKSGWIVLDQIRTVDKARLIRKMGNIQKKEILKVKEALSEMLIK